MIKPNPEGVLPIVVFIIAESLSRLRFGGFFFCFVAIVKSIHPWQQSPDAASSSSSFFLSLSFYSSFSLLFLYFSRPPLLLPARLLG